jgi:hypothetical protein
MMIIDSLSTTGFGSGSTVAPQYPLCELHTSSSFVLPAPVLDPMSIVALLKKKKKKTVEYSVEIVDDTKSVFAFQNDTDERRAKSSKNPFQVNVSHRTRHKKTIARLCVRSRVSRCHDAAGLYHPKYCPAIQAQLA